MSLPRVPCTAATSDLLLAARQKCVELLRKQKLGVATFLILEKQQHLAAQMSKAASPPEGASRFKQGASIKCTNKSWLVVTMESRVALHLSHVCRPARPLGESCSVHGLTHMSWLAETPYKCGQAIATLVTVVWS